MGLVGPLCRYLDIASSFSLRRRCVVFLWSEVGSCTLSHLTTHPGLCGGDPAGCECQMLDAGPAVPVCTQYHRAVRPVVVVALTVIATMKPTSESVSAVISPRAGCAGVASPVRGWPLHICSLFFRNLVKHCVVVCSCGFKVIIYQVCPFSM